MSVQWNVNDIGVFKDLASSIAQTVSMLSDISTEVLESIQSADNLCRGELTRVDSKIKAQQLKIEYLTEQLEALDDDDDGKRAEIQALLAEANSKLAALESAQAKLRQILGAIEDAKFNYERSFDDAQQDYETDVLNVGRLLARFHELLQQSLNGGEGGFETFDVESVPAQGKPKEPGTPGQPPEPQPGQTREPAGGQAAPQEEKKPEKPQAPAEKPEAAAKPAEAPEKPAEPAAEQPAGGSETPATPPSSGAGGDRGSAQ